MLTSSACFHILEFGLPGFFNVFIWGLQNRLCMKMLQYTFFLLKLVIEVLPVSTDHTENSTSSTSPDSSPEWVSVYWRIFSSFVHCNRHFPGPLRLEQLGALSTHVFEVRKATGREHFACQDSGVSPILILIISNGEKILSNVNVVVWRQVKKENSSLPVAVRVWKSRLLKLPNLQIQLFTLEV